MSIRPATLFNAKSGIKQKNKAIKIGRPPKIRQARPKLRCHSCPPVLSFCGAAESLAPANLD